MASPGRRVKPNRPPRAASAAMPQRPAVVGVHHRDVARLLVPEDARLGRRVVLDAGVAVEVVGREVRAPRHRGPAPHPSPRAGSWTARPRSIRRARPSTASRERRPEVSADEGASPPAWHERAEQRGGGALAVGAGDAEQRPRPAGGTARRARPRPTTGTPALAGADDGRAARSGTPGLTTTRSRPAEVDLPERGAAQHGHAAADERLGAELRRGALVPERHPRAGATAAARSAASPLLPAPSTATVRSCRGPRQRSLSDISATRAADDGDDPEAHDDLRLGQPLAARSGGGSAPS